MGRCFSMKNIQLLDCTLRDGGYLNDWEFGHDTLVNIFERVVSSGVDIIEIGFLDDRRIFDINRSIMPNTQAVEQIYGGLERKNTMVVGMIDYGTCSIENLQPCEESFLDGIRVIFKQQVMHEAIQFCREVQDLGYRVFVQAVSITTYSDEDLLELVDLVNELHPYAMSMVDTYGLLHQSNLYHIFEVLDYNLRPDISIGYHAHNNFQMGYANGIEMIEAETERPMLVDGSLYGMGKSAGNAPLELLAMYMNENCGKNYDVSQMLEAIETSIMDIHNQVHWGYNLFYYVAASNKVHPNYVSYLMNKKTLSIKSINELLKRIEEPQKLLFSESYIEKLYRTYENCECDDTAAMGALTQRWENRDIMVVGPGKSWEEYQAQIWAFRTKHNPVTIAINFIPEYWKPDYIFLTNSKRYLQLSSQISRQENEKIKIIATSNVTKTSGTFDFTLNYGNLIDASAQVPDNSLLMLMRALLSIKVKSVVLAGFDGYDPEKMNYFKTNMEYSDIHEKAQELNRVARDFFKKNAEQLHFEFITPSLYQ